MGRINQHLHQNNRNTSSASSKFTSSNPNYKRRNHFRNNRTTTLPKEKKTCIVCSIATDRYKCPKCFMRYCSIDCYRTHKESCNTKAEEDKNKVISSTTSNTLLLPKNIINHNNSYPIAVSLDDQIKQQPGWKVTTEMKQNLTRNSSWIRNELKKHIGLRKLVRDIITTSSSDEEKLANLQHVKLHNPSFCTFLDELLLKAGILSTDDEIGKERRLFLTPAPSRKNSLILPKEEIGENSSSSTSSDSSSSSSDDDDDDSILTSTSDSSTGSSTNSAT